MFHRSNGLFHSTSTLFFSVLENLMKFHMGDFVVAFTQPLPISVLHSLWRAIRSPRPPFSPIFGHTCMQTSQKHIYTNFETLHEKYK